MITLLGLVSGVSFATVNATTNTLEWWQWLLISIATTLIGALIDVGKTWLINKGYVKKEDADKIADHVKDEIKDKVEDLADDGEINNSNK